MDSLFLGIDIGTTAVKAAVIDADGNRVATASLEYPTYHLGLGKVEQDPHNWWQAVVKVLRKIVGESPGLAERIASIAVSSQAPTLLPVDFAGRPLRRAIIWMDGRAQAEAQRLESALGAQTIIGITGNRPDPFYIAPKIMWLRRHEPKVLKQTKFYLQANGFINYQLCGRFTLDAAHAGLLLLVDTHGQWSAPLCKACKIDPSLFPPVSPCHEVVGLVSEEAARLTGLKCGTPVCAGTVDSAAAAIEAGAIDPGTAAEMTGTSTVLIMPVASKVVDPAFITMPHAIPGRRLLLGAMTSTGASLRWFRDQFGQAEVTVANGSGRDAFDLLTAEAAVVSAGCDGLLFLPYMMGERSPLWNTSARGVLSGLSLATSKGAVVRAILEGAAFALRHNLEIARRAGIPINTINSVGGGARSPLWNQIKADVVGLPILLPEGQVGAALGAAMLAGLGVGHLSITSSMPNPSFQVRARYEPDRARHERYTELFQVFRATYENLKPCFATSESLRTNWANSISPEPVCANR